MKTGRITDMTEGNAFKLIIMFSLPMLLGNIFNQLYNVADSIIVGKFIGDNALAAVGTGFPIIFMITSLFSGFSTGATVLIAQFYGSRDFENMEKTADTVYGAMLIGSIPLTIIGVVFCEMFLYVTNVPLDIFSDSKTYISIILMGMVCSLGYQVNTGILRGLGDSKTSLIFLSISCVINIALDVILIVVFNVGITGVAISTVVAQFFSWIMGCVYIKKKYYFLKLNPLNINKDLLKRILGIGIPYGLQQSIFSIGRLSIQSLANSFGTNFMAGFNVAGRLDSFAYMPMQSFNNAVVTYTAQNIGAKKMDRVIKGTRGAMLLSCSVSIIIGGAVIIFAENLMQIFSLNPEVILSGSAYIYRILPFYCMLSVFDIWNSAMRGAGKMIVPMLSTVISLWIARVPAAYIFADLYGKYNMFFCYAAGWVIGLIISGYFYFNGKWRKNIEIENELIDSRCH